MRPLVRLVDLSISFLLSRCIISEFGIQNLETVGIGLPAALAALLVVPLIRMAAPPAQFAAVAEEKAKIPLVPLQALVEIDARHVPGRADGRGMVSRHWPKRTRHFLSARDRLLGPFQAGVEVATSGPSGESNFKLSGPECKAGRG